MPIKRRIKGYLLTYLDRPADISSFKFISLINTFALCQHVTEPTRDRGELLDIIITRAVEWFEQAEVVDIGLSDHRLIKGVLHINPPMPIYETITSHPGISSVLRRSTRTSCSFHHSQRWTIKMQVSRNFKTKQQHFNWPS